MEHFVGIQCSTTVYYDVVVKVSGNIDIGAAQKIALKEVKDRFSEVKINPDYVDMSESTQKSNWEIDGLSLTTYDNGYGIDLEVDT